MMKRPTEKPRLLQFLVVLIRRHVPSMRLGIIALLAVNSLLLFIPLILAHVVDVFSQEAAFSVQTVLFWAGVFLALNVVIFFLRLCWRRFIIFPSYEIERDTKKSLFAHMLSLCKKSLREYSVGTQIALISRETTQLSEAISWGTLALVDGLFTIVSVSIILLILYPSIAWVALLLYPLTSVMLYVVWRKTGKLYEVTQERIAHISELTRQMFTHIGDIKAHNSEGFYIDKFSKDGNAILKMQIRIAVLEALLWPTALFIHGIALVITLFLGMRAIQMGSASIGDLFAVMNYLTQIQQPFLGLGFALSIQQKGLSNARRIKTVLHTHSTLSNSADALAKPIAGALQLQDLRFEYPRAAQHAQEEQGFCISGINLAVPAGTWLGITGRIGCGKSTLAMLLARLYDVDGGTLLWDDVPIAQYDIATLRRHVLLQTQDFQLFSTSILQNIAFTEYEMDEKGEGLARKYGMFSCLENDVATFADSWHTTIGEAGVRLSGGQKQRIALARTLYAEPPVLILDDVFSELDNKTARVILENLQQIRGDKTTVIITHNLPILSNTKRILVMERGQIIEDGTHEQLLQHRGQYMAQWKDYMIAKGEYLA